MPGRLFYGDIVRFPHTAHQTYGWAVTHAAPDGTPVSVLWTAGTAPEMSPGSHRYAALHHAVTLLEEGALWPDQITVTHWAGRLGTWSFTGDEAEELYHVDYTEEQQDPRYWALIDAAEQSY